MHAYFGFVKPPGPNKYPPMCIMRRAMYLLLNELLEKSYHIMTLKKLKTIMPSHLDQAAEAMGLTKAYLVSADDIDIPKSNIVKAAKETLAKHRRGLRVSREAVERLTEIVGVALIRWIRSAVGLVAHCGRKRLNSRDLKNIAPIAQNVPHISLHNPGYDHYYTGDVGRGG
jgi:histone H3/H4